jgi:hypothetical protein
VKHSKLLQNLPFHPPSLTYRAAIMKSTATITELPVGYMLAMKETCAIRMRHESVLTGVHPNGEESICGAVDRTRDGWASKGAKGKDGHEHSGSPTDVFNIAHRHSGDWKKGDEGTRAHAEYIKNSLAKVQRERLIYLPVDQSNGDELAP